MKFDNDNNKPMIVSLPDGPLYLINDREPKVTENLVNSKGEKLSNIQGIALCRCGASKNKPFCDGTHSTIEFSSKNNNQDNKVNDKNKTSLKGKRKSYDGKKITIHDNRSICSHAAECVNNLPSVFRLNQRPWIDPDQEKVTIDKIIETIRKCPSGALSYSIDGIEYRDYDGKPLVKVSKDGPYLISGGIELIGLEADFPKDVSKEHYTLCRCGASNNKPFCDGSHSTINFKDEKN
ncbi:MAG: CDGSH iron-sulfur domain-containing protein [Nitrososphaeraceae archaeon]